jgi:LCP family protein required for cell wall assembly
MTDSDSSDGGAEDSSASTSAGSGAASRAPGAGSHASGPGGQDPGADGPPPGADHPARDAEQTRSGRRQAGRKRTIFARHKVLTTIAAVLALVLGAAGLYIWDLNRQFGNIDRAYMGVEEPPEGAPAEKDRPLNILLLGSDNGGTSQQSVAQDLEDGEWTPFMHRSDTLMIVHIPADRDSVQLVSIPRDTWVTIDDYPYNDERAKINAAFAYGGPSLARQTVEDLTDIRVDHVAVIDWEGFKDLTSALGGIRVYIPEEFYDSSQQITWEQGWQELEGATALRYVRTRYDIPGDKQGDYGRIARQQNFLRATMEKLLSGGTTRNPLKLRSVLKVITSYLTVDDTWSNGEIRDLAMSMRSLNGDDVEFLTIPTSCCDTSNDGQSIVRLERKQAAELFDAITQDDIASYVEAYPDETLEGEKEVN